MIFVEERVGIRRNQGSWAFRSVNIFVIFLSCYFIISDQSLLQKYPYSYYNEYRQQLEQMQPQPRNPCFCFNPHCPHPFDRLIPPSTESHKNCKPWILDYHKYALREQQAMEETGTGDGKLCFLIGERLIGSLMTACKMREGMVERLEGYMERLREELCKRIDGIEQLIKIKLHLYFQPITKSEAAIKNFLHSYTQNSIPEGKQSYKILQIVNEFQFSSFSNMEDMVLNCQMPQLENRIYGPIKDFSRIFRKREQPGLDIDLSQQQRVQLVEYLQDPNDDHTRKLSKISTALNIKQKDLYQKQAKPPNSLNANPDLIVKCPLCPASYSTDRRKELMGVWGAFTGHLLGVHLEDAGYYWARIVTGRLAGPTTVEEIVYKMACYSYEALEIITRSGRKNYRFSHQNRRRFSVDLIVDSQPCSLPIKTLPIADNNDLFTLVTTVAFHLQKRQINKPIYVYVCNLTEIAGLRRAINGYGLTNVVLVTEKESDKEKEAEMEIEEEEGGKGQEEADLMEENKQENEQ